MLFIEVLNQMYRLAGGLKHAGQGLNGSQQDEGLHVANAILDSIKTSELPGWPSIIRTEFSTIQNQDTYTIGAAVDNADWVIERPEKILRAGYLVPGQTRESELPMSVLYDWNQYALITNKQVTSSLSWVMYYKATLPVGRATLWPVPYQAFNVAIYTPDYINEFTDVMDTILWPKGWREFMEYCGAVALHDRNPLWPMLPGVEKRAGELKSKLAASQWKPNYIRSDEGALARPDAQGRWWGAREWPGGY